MLQECPGIRPIAVFEEVQRRHPELGTCFRRTLERRIRAWKAEHGPEQEVIFRQKHEPSKMGLPDFTNMNELSVTVTGNPLRHRLYHFRLAYNALSYDFLSFCAKREPQISMFTY